MTEKLVIGGSSYFFPGCDRPPGWCQTHHVLEFRNGGPTTVDNGVLLCGHHHRTFEHAGWTIHIIDGQPWWTPPRWIDPHQRPVRNTAHDTATQQDHLRTRKPRN